VRHADLDADGIVADYAFLTPSIPYVLQPHAPAAVIMHDLFSSRGTQFAAIGGKDSVAALTLQSELDLLDKADGVVAIQSTEAALVQSHLPHKQVIVAPMAVETVPSPQPGLPNQLLFVGSSNAPNIDGIQWFLAEIWPRIRAEAPEAVLRVAGRVCSSIKKVPEGVNLLGFVDDLDTLYQDAAVVISPLRTGSGLKVKLVEALGYGKAVVATPATLQGVEEAVSSAVPATDDPAGFAYHVLELLRDERLRAKRCAETLKVAERHFSAAACYTGLVEFFASTSNVPSPTRGQDAG
jgi:succinoglycan biosynthesis protein ExoO